MPNELGDLYESFWQKFIQVLRDQPFECHPAQIHLDKEDTGISSRGKNSMIQIALREPIYLGNWVAHTKKHTKSDIEVMVREQYIRNAPTVSTYTANEVTYLRHSTTESTPECAHLYLKNKVRFDFDPEQVIVEKPDHPVFHAHLVHETKVTLPAHFVGRRKLNIANDSDNDAEIRLPSARMCFPSVLCLLIADHLGADLLHELLTQTVDIRRELRAPPACIAWGDHMHDQNKGAQRFHGIDWYHKKAVEESPQKGKKSARR